VGNPRGGGDMGATGMKPERSCMPNVSTLFIAAADYLVKKSIRHARRGIRS
jgi:hypothetical protein